jgi:hypothetical protein
MMDKVMLAIVVFGFALLIGAVVMFVVYLVRPRRCECPRLLVARNVWSVIS